MLGQKKNMCGLGCTLKKTRVGRNFFTFFLEYSDLLGNVINYLVIILVVHQSKGAGTQHSKTDSSTFSVLTQTPLGWGQKVKSF